MKTGEGARVEPGPHRCVRCRAVSTLVLREGGARCGDCGALFPLVDGAIPILLAEAADGANAYGTMFGADAERYDERFQVEAEHGRWVLRRLLEIDPALAAKRGGHVVEVGAGSGHLTRALEEHEAWPWDLLTVTDLSPEMLAANRRRSRSEDRVRFWVCNLRDLPLPDASADAILGFDVLHHVLDYREALRELARVVKPGGIVALKEPHRGAYRVMTYVAAAALRLHRRAPAAGLFSAADERTVCGWTKHLETMLAFADAGDHAALRELDDKYLFEPALLAADARAAGFEEIRQANVLDRPGLESPNAPMILDAFRGLGITPAALTVVAEVAEDLDRTMGAQLLREFPVNTVFLFSRGSGQIAPPETPVS
jgi:ubiquinone/menaquinone biosynthesis C-methylase UbiE